jgi:Cu(I)/Ag(I) efflux system membrane fusion protein
MTLIALATGLLTGWYFSGTGNMNDKKQNAVVEHDKKAEIWTCSMHPQIREDGPGKCPICGMNLIPVIQTKNIEKKEDTNPNEIPMTPSAIALANIQTTVVKKGAPEKKVYLLGKIKPDERKIAELTARFSGRIEKLFVNYTGQNVKKGEKLATIYSPDLITAQRELLEAIKYKSTNPSFYNAARSKLKLWDLTDQQIDRIENSADPVIYFDILSPVTGTVTKKEVSIGDYVKEGSSLFEVINLSKVWVMFEAYESDLPWINIGDKIKFTLEAFPGKTYEGKVTFIDPLINPQTRVAQVRLEIKNNGLRFKPEMFVNGILESKTAKDTNKIMIPRTAVLWTGKRSVVYVKVPGRQNPTFLYRQITLGPDAGNFYVVEKGLQAGEEIAVNGVFKIDASAQLAGKPSMMNPQGGKTSTGHNHGGKTMTDEEMKNMENASINTDLK